MAQAICDSFFISGEILPYSQMTVKGIDGNRVFRTQFVDQFHHRILDPGERLAHCSLSYPEGGRMTARRCCSRTSRLSAACHPRAL